MVTYNLPQLKIFISVSGGKKFYKTWYPSSLILSTLSHKILEEPVVCFQECTPDKLQLTQTYFFMLERYST